jgi:hypothetical protein
MRLVIGSLRQQESFYISNSTKGGRLGRVKLKRAGEVAQVKVFKLDRRALGLFL